MLRYQTISIALAALTCAAFTACPPVPVVPDAGTGGSVVIVDAGTGGSTPLGDARPDAPACQYPTGSCCRSCAVLSAHGCPEGKPTAGGISCETVCVGSLVTMPDLGGCSSLACIRTKLGGNRACPGGR